jgi:hypothetical protein
MEQHGNTTTYNVENVLRQNIQSSEYFSKTCQEMTVFEHIVDEIYENVDHVEPWMSGNARGPSTCFCLLFRLFELKLNVKQVLAKRNVAMQADLLVYNSLGTQIKDLIDHRDSPYIRAVRRLVEATCNNHACMQGVTHAILPAHRSASCTSDTWPTQRPFGDGSSATLTIRRCVGTQQFVGPASTNSNPLLGNAPGVPAKWLPGQEHHNGRFCPGHIAGAGKSPFLIGFA